MSPAIFDPKSKVILNWDRVHELFETGNPAPVLVEIDPSNACNHGCYFCISSYIHLPESKNLPTYNKTIMSREILLPLCQDLIDLGVRAIAFSGGGEPTVNPALKEAITLIGNNSAVKMGMFTNGTLLDRFDLFETVCRYLTWIRISVDAGRPETYNAIRRANNNEAWDKMVSNLRTLIEVNAGRIDLGVGFVITPDNYEEIEDFARFFSQFDVTYCQFKPEVVNHEREQGVQRTVHFWTEKVAPRLEIARQLLGSKFQINGYKLNDLENDPTAYGRSYKKCLGSQIQPCVGADGHVYVCVNHRGYKQYSYGSLYDRSFTEIWSDIRTRRQVMQLIEEKECFANCTQLCKPHESNKVIWDLQQRWQADPAGLLEDVRAQQSQLQDKIRHPEFI